MASDRDTLAQMAKAIHDARWQNANLPDGDSDCGHGSEPGECEEQAAAALAAYRRAPLDADTENAGARTADDVLAIMRDHEPKLGGWCDSGLYVECSNFECGWDSDPPYAPKPPYPAAIPYSEHIATLLAAASPSPLRATTEPPLAPCEHGLPYGMCTEDRCRKE